MVINKLLTRKIQVVSQEPLFFQLSFIFFQGFHSIIDFEQSFVPIYKVLLSPSFKVVHLHR